ncbi:MAG TPA: single-stranded-DNA-specific exonuclease RecJ [Planctomycetaceae bacterium]|nr:single-stranded-DNA-specific exonuclease RecJ [Planctomycetaceae bacterium]HRF02255.1 single-stranded-DNA-specific exonuclease RecJ [Pirellulaceae bacterium]
MPGRIWKFRPFEETLVADLERDCRVAPVVAHLLASRGLRDPKSCREFLDNRLTGLHDPALLPGCDAAARRLLVAIERREKIAVYGDYDADGMTATAMLVGVLKRLQADVIFHVPNRLDDGYGLNRDAIDLLAERGCRLIVTVDCGVSAIDQAQHAARLGLDLIVTDHHELASELPPAVAIVHPRLPGHDYPCGDLCGAGVAFKLVWRLIQLAGGSESGARVHEKYRDFLFRALALASVGTIADVVPLVGENRVLVAHGLLALRAAPPLGLRQLMTLAKLADRPALSSEDVAFMLAPRLNAAGRLGQAPLGVELLLTESDERAEQLARYIDELNGNRDSLERSILKGAHEQIKLRFDPEQVPAFVLADRGWHAGVIGVVAGRLAEKYHRPVVMISLDANGSKPGIGSARAGGKLDLHAALHECAAHLVSYGGHQAAAGMRIDEQEVEAFRERFCEVAEARLSALDRTPELDIDAETPLVHLTVGAVEEIERLAPFGQGNPRPILCTRRVELAEPPRRIGGGERHLAIRLKQHQSQIRGVAFGKGEWADEIAAVDGPLDVAYRPVINEFAGRRSAEIHLVDWRPAER